MNCQPYNYPYCEFDFYEWNPVQKQCLQYFDCDCNLVVNSSTASGKSAIAEAIMGYELCTSQESKAIYVSPLKAIGHEKFEQWQRHPTFENYDCLLVSGDTKAMPAEFEQARLVVSTVESLAIRCRNCDKWLQQARALIFDEAHLLNDAQRGAGAEAMIMALGTINPNCRIICLSGTMSNYIEIAKWLKSCNGKKTYFVKSDWRPTELVKKVEVVEGYNEQYEKVLQMARELDSNGKMLAFVHSKANGEKLCEYLKKNGIRNAFYNASLRPSIRGKMLEDFRNEYSDLNVLVCTSSLGMGVTL